MRRLCDLQIASARLVSVIAKGGMNTRNWLSLLAVALALIAISMTFPEQILNAVTFVLG